MLAYDAATHTTGMFTVTAVLVHSDPAQVHLSIGGTPIATTPAHPFFTLERGWVAAGDLWSGAHVRRADGQYDTVWSVVVEVAPQVMYNLTVAQAHTFFVGIGRWLVHNSSCFEFAKRLPNGAEIAALLDKDGVLWTAVDVPEALKNQGVGSGLFGEAWKALGDRAHAIGGKWNTEMPDNLNTFNARLNAGRSLEQAALETFTGKQAIARGFSQVTINVLRGHYGAYTNVEVIFR